MSFFGEFFKGIAGALGFGAYSSHHRKKVAKRRQQQQEEAIRNQVREAKIIQQRNYNSKAPNKKNLSARFLLGIDDNIDKSEKKNKSMNIPEEKQNFKTLNLKRNVGGLNSANTLGFRR